MYAGAPVVTDLVVVKRGNRQTRKELWWKRRLENKVNMLNKYLGRVNAIIQHKTIKKKQKDTLQRRYEIRQKRLGLVKETKQRIVAKTGKIKTFSNRITQYLQNRLFHNNQHRFYQTELNLTELNEEGQQQENLAPDQWKARKFSSDIWNKEVEWKDSYNLVVQGLRGRQNR